MRSCMNLHGGVARMVIVRAVPCEGLVAPYIKCIRGCGRHRPCVSCYCCCCGCGCEFRFQHVDHSLETSAPACHKVWCSQWNFVIHDSLTPYCVALWWMWCPLQLAREGHEHRLFHRRISIETFWKGRSLDPFFSRKRNKSNPNSKSQTLVHWCFCVHTAPTKYVNLYRLTPKRCFRCEPSLHDSRYSLSAYGTSSERGQTRCLVACFCSAYVASGVLQLFQNDGRDLQFSGLLNCIFMFFQFYVDLYASTFTFNFTSPSSPSYLFILSTSKFIPFPSNFVSRQDATTLFRDYINPYFKEKNSQEVTWTYFDVRHISSFDLDGLERFLINDWEGMRYFISLCNILLMEEILHHLGYINLVNNEINYISTGAGFLPSKVVLLIGC